MSVYHAFKLAVTVESEQQISNPTCFYIQLVCLAQTRIPFKLLQVQGPLQYKLPKSWRWLGERPWPETVQSDPKLCFYNMGEISVPGYRNSEAVTGCLNVCLGPLTHMPSGMKASLLCNVKVRNNSSKPHFSAGWSFFASIFSEVSSKSIVHVVDVIPGHSWTHCHGKTPVNFALVQTSVSCLKKQWNVVIYFSPYIRFSAVMFRDGHCS